MIYKVILSLKHNRYMMNLDIVDVDIQVPGRLNSSHCISRPDN